MLISSTRKAQTDGTTTMAALGDVAFFFPEKRKGKKNEKHKKKKFPMSCKELTFESSLNV